MRTLAGVLAVLALAGCGGDGGGPLSAAEFDRRANEICAESVERKRAIAESVIPDSGPSTYLEIHVYLTEYLPFLEETLEKLGSLEPPPEKAERFKAVVAGFEEAHARLGELARAIEARDGEAVLTRWDEAFAAADPTQTDAGALGLDDCTDIAWLRPGNL